MMKALVMFFLFIGASQGILAKSSCIPNPYFIHQDDDRDGSSYEKAIIIEETNSSDGIAAEYKWLSKHYPGYKFLKQALSPYQDKYYDILFIKYKGKKIAVYFDINYFFGKY